MSGEGMIPADPTQHSRAVADIQAAYHAYVGVGITSLFHGRRPRPLSDVPAEALEAEAANIRALVEQQI